VEQAKVKILKQLRKFLDNESLGLYELKFDENEVAPPPRAPKQPPAPPGTGQGSSIKGCGEKKPEAAPRRPRTVPSAHGVRAIAQGRERRPYYRRSHPGEQARLLARRQEQDQKKPEESQKPVTIPVELGGQVTITIEVKAQEKKGLAFEPPVAEAPPPGPPIPPETSDRVFVDITAYNTKDYYVQGDVATPGKLPFTGRETVLDALQFAGGLVWTADPKGIHLVRPVRGGRPAKVYKVDLEGITVRGDVTSNYQLFPGDRLIVGRSDVAKRTIQLDRLSG
jgi:hypothetical protein